MPASRNKVIYRYWLFSSDFCKTSWIFLHDPVCPKTEPVLSKNLVRSVLKPGPFCPGTWSVLSLDVVRFVLKRGPFCLVRFVHGPFCPSTFIFACWVQKTNKQTLLNNTPVSVHPPSQWGKITRMVPFINFTCDLDTLDVATAGARTSQFQIWKSVNYGR